MDRNYQSNAVDQILPGSLSARRAWIEITVVGVLATLVTVALRKESVDRNWLRRLCGVQLQRRSPQGERG